MIYDTQNLIAAAYIAEGETFQHKKDLVDHANDVIAAIKLKIPESFHNRMDDLYAIIEYFSGTQEK